MVARTDAVGVTEYGHYFRTCVRLKIHKPPTPAVKRNSSKTQANHRSCTTHTEHDGRPLLCRSNRTHCTLGCQTTATTEVTYKSSTRHTHKHTITEHCLQLDGSGGILRIHYARPSDRFSGRLVRLLCVFFFAGWLAGWLSTTCPMRM